jgi:hypothetical protein
MKNLGLAEGDAIPDEVQVNLDVLCLLMMYRVR